MSHYLAGGLMLLLLCATTLLGLDAYSAYDAARMVQAALADGQSQLSADGGVSPAVVRLVRRRIEAEGGEPARLQVSGSPQKQPYGQAVTLTLLYEHPYSWLFLTPGAPERKAGIFRVVRSVTVTSGWQP